MDICWTTLVAIISIKPSSFWPISCQTSIFSCKFWVWPGSNTIETVTFRLSSDIFELYGGKYILFLSSFNSSFLFSLNSIFVPIIRH